MTIPADSIYDRPPSQRRHTGTVARTGRCFSHITRRSRPRYSRPIPRLSRGPYVRRRSTAAVSRGATTTARPARTPASAATARRAAGEPAGRGPGKSRIKSPVSTPQGAGSRSRFIQPSCGHRHCGARARLHAHARGARAPPPPSPDTTPRNAQYTVSVESHRQHAFRAASHTAHTRHKTPLLCNQTYHA